MHQNEMSSRLPVIVIDELNACWGLLMLKFHFVKLLELNETWSKQNPNLDERMMMSKNISLDAQDISQKLLKAKDFSHI